jgi:nucleoside-diphosphate-sugar epimerase
VQGLLLAAEVDAAPGNAYWIADAEPYELRRILATVREALAAEGLPVVDREPPRVPALVGTAAEVADRVIQSRGRYVQAAHVLGELRHTIACDITKARTELGYEPQTSLLDGMRASIRWCLDRGMQL